MPCSSEYMEPTVAERQRKHAAELLVFVKQKLGLSVSKEEKASAKSFYGEGGEKSMVKLCTILRGMTSEEEERVVYDARDPMSRKLADWWEEHQAEDAKREAKQTRKK